MYYKVARSLGFLIAGSLLTSAAFTCSGSPPGNAAAETATNAAGVAKKVLLPAPAFARDGATTVADVAERSVASVVNISSERVARIGNVGPFRSDPFFQQFFGGGFGNVPQERQERSLGSGVIVSKDGIILTNNHVVEKADEIQVTLPDGSDREAKIVGTDPDTDIAVLRLEGDVSGLKPLELGDSSALRLGDVVLAIGDPFGVGETVTMGIVSATGRANVGITDYEDFIQTDAAINPGNSGGALVDMQGRLVGINTAILSRTGGYQGIGFAIPSNMARNIMQSLLEHGKVERGYLGVVIQDVNPQLVKALHLSTSRGALVSEVGAHSPAAKAGIERGDVIVEVNGDEVGSSSELRNLVATAGAGTKVRLDVLRDGKQRQLTVALAEKPSSPGAVAKIAEGDGSLGGLQLRTLNDDTRGELDIPPQVRRGVVVTNVSPGSPAARAGFRPGDVILEMNREPVTSAGDLKKQYEKARGTIAMLVQRGPHTMFLALPKG